MTSLPTDRIILFTCDLVLTQILNRIVERCNPDYSIIVYDSFSDANTILDQDCNKLILIDDIIIGTSSFELITFLRLNKKVCSPIIYFGVNEHGNEKKAITIGANYFINKPFNPDDLINLLKSIIQ